MSDARGAADSDTDVFERADTGKSQEQDERWVGLPPAGMLSVADADALLRWREASVVAVVGERNGGKTTLVTELYERFLRGPFADTLFRHSLSLLGFERKSFQSRMESGAERPDTPRTSKQDGLSFFHLGLADAADLRRTDLLLSERAGEVYREVRDKPAGASELVEIRRARVVVFIVDGERVADDRRRAEAFASVRNIARAIADSGVVPPDAVLQAVTTKCDLLTGDQNAAALEALTSFEELFIGQYASRFASATTHRTAARAPHGALEAGHGLAPLLRRWLTPPAASPIPAPSMPELTDEFDRLLLRGGL